MEQINKILEELYEIDPEFRKHEDKIIKIINELLESKPRPRIDDEFVNDLRQELMFRAENFSDSKEASSSGFATFMNFNKFSFVLGAAAVLVLIITPVLLFSGLGDQKLATDKVELALNSGVKELDDNAFGSLSAVNTAMNAPEGRGASEMQEDGMAGEKMAFGLGAGGSTDALAVEDEASRMMIAPEFLTRYEYIYEGEEFSVDKEKMKVYRRGELGGGKAFAEILSQVNLDLIDLSKFGNAKVTSINLSEEKEFGYNVYLNFEDNSLGLYKNWNKWPRPDSQEITLEKALSSTMPARRSTLSIDDIPADNKIIAVANNFLSEYGINMSAYGTGEVQDNWRRSYQASENKNNFYIPQEITVVYPLIIEGKLVYDQGGNKAGLNVNVDIVNNKVSSVNQIKAHSFESSMYDVVSDENRIMELAENKGSMGYPRRDDSAKTVKISLGTPDLRLVSFWRHDPEKGVGEELFVPSYVFPITDQPEEYFYRQNVVVPLVESLIEEPRMGIPEPMPMIMDQEQEEGSAGGEDSPAMQPVPDRVRAEVELK